PPVAAKDDELRKLLVGTWGHQDNDLVMYISLNGDDTFATKREYKKTFDKLFREDVRSSGTWKLQDGVVIANVTASTNSDVRGHVFSYRIRSVSATEVLCVDQFGRLWREWKTR